MQANVFLGVVQMLNSVLELISKGMYVYPVKIANKQPMTAHGFKDATNDAEQVKTWFSGENMDNTGVAINLEKSGLVCLDIDNGHSTEDDRSGIQEMTKIAAAHGYSLDDADYIESTQSGGIHAFYKRPKYEVNKRNLSKHVELLTDSTIIAPTKAYKAVKGEIWNVSKQAPKWMLSDQSSSYSIPKGQKIMYGNKTKLARGLELLIYPETAGNRHNALISLIGALFYAGTDIEVIRYLVYTAAEKMSLPETEVDEMLTWAINQSIKQLQSKGE